MIGVIYARYSAGPNQNDQSIEGQVSDCMEYAKRNNIEVVKIYADKSISGKSTQGRAQFLAMMDDAREEKFEAVIVWKIDRFGRNRGDIALNKRVLKEHGIKLHYAAESVPDTPEGIILESVMEGLAEYYSADLSQKISRGVRESAKKGIVPHASIPYGYKRKADKTLEVDYTIAPYIKKAFEMYAKGAKLSEVIEMLTNAGIRSKNGRNISNAVLYRVFRNTAYLGQIDVLGVVVEIEPLIDADLFAAVQERNANAYNTRAKSKGKVDYLLSCKAYCKECGGMLIGESGASRSGEKYYYYKCGNKKRKVCECSSPNFIKDELEEWVIECTLQDALTDEVIEDLVSAIMKLQNGRRGETETLINKRTALQLKIDRCVNAIVDGLGSEAVYKKLESLEAEMKELNKQIAQYQIEKPTVPADLIRCWLLGIRNGDIESPAFRKQLIDTFVTRVDVGAEDITVHFDILGVCSDTTSSMDLTQQYPNHTPFVWNNQIILLLPMPRHIVAGKYA